MPTFVDVSLPRTRDLWIYQGNTMRMSLTLVERPSDEAPRPKDLTGYTAAAQIRRSAESSVLAQFSAVISDPVGGKISLELSAPSTANLAGDAVWDVTTTSPDGVVRTWLTGTVHVIPRVTR